MKIIIKQYQEFTEEVEISADMEVSDVVIVAKEIEAVIQTENDIIFSIGFSVMRDNPIFDLDNPRDIVREFLKINIFGSGNFPADNS